MAYSKVLRYEILANVPIGVPSNDDGSGVGGCTLPVILIGANNDMWEQ